MSVNLNADDYANNRIGIFFPGFPNSLTGQCVSLNKWFLAEMTSVPNPQSGRGNAKDFGDTLVNQGHAYVVAANDRKRGDIVVWKGDGGGYGHIGLLLSGDRVFEENVGLAGAPSMNVPDGEGGFTKVYASRIDPLYQNWRKGAPTFYRVRSYSEGDEPMISNVDNEFGRWSKLYNQIRDTEVPPTRQQFIDAAVGRSWLTAMEILSDNPSADAAVQNRIVGRQARQDNWPQQIYDLQAANKTAQDALADARKQIDQLDDRPTPEQLATLQATLKEAEDRASAAQKALDDKLKQDTKTDDALTAWLRALWKKITGGK